MTAIIGPSGNGKSTLADAFGFLADCLEIGVEAACDGKTKNQISGEVDFLLSWKQE